MLGFAIISSDNRVVSGNELLQEQLKPLEATVYDVVSDLAKDVSGIKFVLPIDSAAEAEEERNRLYQHLDDHLLDRLSELASPAVVVIAGSTGAGKSTILNSLLESNVSVASAIRPTTKKPVLVYNPLDEDVMDETMIVTSVEAKTNEKVPRGIALLDSPDIDSLASDNHELAHRLLDGADLWLFVTTASRYGDALPWNTLAKAVERGATVAMVLNRVPDDALKAVRADLLHRLRDNGLAKAPLFIVPDIGPHTGLLPTATVANINRWLGTLGGSEHIHSVVLRTLKGSLESLIPWSQKLVVALEEQQEAAGEIADVALSIVPSFADAISEDLVSADLVKGAVTSAWNRLSEEGKFGKLISRSGYSKTNAKLAKQRAELITALASEIKKTVQTYCLAKLNTVVAQFTTQLADLPGSVKVIEVAKQAGNTSKSETKQEAAQVAKKWLTLLEENTVTGFPDTRQANSAQKAFSIADLSTMISAAALGLKPAENLLEALLGVEARQLIEDGQKSLMQSIVGFLKQQLLPAIAVLDDENLRDAKIARLRIRIKELERLL